MNYESMGALMHPSINIESLQNTVGFPFNIFPEVIQKFIKEQSFALGCPADFIGMSVLATASVAIGNTRKIQLKKNWIEGATLYCGIVAEPGSKKTAAINKAMKPLYDIQAENKRDYDHLMINYNLQLQEYQMDLEAWKKQIKGKGINLALGDFPEPPCKPTFEQIITVDTTMESLLELMSDNPRGIIQYRDELVSFVKSMNQYRTGADRQYWLSMWSNETIIVNRKGKEALEIAQPFCSVIGGIQPDVIEDLISGTKHDGFLDRFLFVYPKPVKSYWTDYDVTEEVCSSYDNIIKKIYSTSYKQENPMLIKLSDEAKQVFTTWFNNITEEAAKSTLSSNLKGVYEKLKGQCARIMLILHTLRFYNGDTLNETIVDEETAIFTCYFIDCYLKPNLEKVFQYLELSEREKQAIKVIERIKNNGHKTIEGRPYMKANELNNAKVCGRKTNKQMVNQLLEYMELEGYGSIESSMVNGQISINFVLDSDI
jgi:Protein of unknown function (DUF3987)